VRSFLETEIKEAIIPYIETATFPDPLVAKIKAAKLLGHFFKKPYGYGTSCMKQGIIALEAARVDPGVATFMIVQCGLLGYTIETLGSEAKSKNTCPKLSTSNGSEAGP
jgi:glutaryl-CoA dehydrogenase